MKRKWFIPIIVVQIMTVLAAALLWLAWFLPTVKVAVFRFATSSVETLDQLIEDGVVTIVPGEESNVAMRFADNALDVHWGLVDYDGLILVVLGLAFINSVAIWFCRRLERKRTQSAA